MAGELTSLYLSRGIGFVTAGAPPPPVYTRLVATRGEMPFQLNTALPADQVKRVCRTRHHFGRQGARGMRAMWCGFYTNGSSGEVNIGNAQTLNASIEIVGAPTPLQRFKFSGVNQGSIANGITFYVSDRLVPTQFGLTKFAESGEFWCKDEREVPTSGACGNSGSPSNPTITGESILVAASGAPTQIDNPGPLVADANWLVPSTNNHIFMPIAFFDDDAFNEISALIFGDSIANRQIDFSGDGVNTAGGFLVRAVSMLGRIPYVNFGNPSERAVLFAGSNGAKRRAILTMLGITHTLIEINTNDGGNGRTAAQAMADNRTNWAFFKSIGVSRIAQCSLPPRATSTDSHRTLANQTPVSGFETGGAFRDPLHAALLANVGSDGLDAFINLSASWADQTQPDKWIVDGVTAALSCDSAGVHPSRLRHGNAATAVYNAEVSAWTPPQG